MLNFDLSSMWASLEVDLKTQGGHGQIKRVLDVINDKIFLFVSNENGQFNIGIAFSKINNPNEIKGAIPACKNLNIWLGSGELPDLFVMLTNSIYKNPFIGLSNLLLKECAARDRKKLIGDTVLSILNEWKYFLENCDPAGLSAELQKGLYGEISFLTDILLTKMSKQNAVNAWMGADRKARDFLFNNGAVEVKTTTSKMHYKMHISSEQQLDPRDTNFLYLVFFKIQEDGKNRFSLKQKVEEARRILADKLDILRLFESKLLSYGYLDIHDEQYQLGYRISDREFYIVDDLFPKLIPTDIHSGVGDVTYTVMASSCSRCLREENMALREMGLE